jgi:RyR domain
LKQGEPPPLDGDAIAVPDSLLPLVEQLARSVHEEWSRARLQQGWKHGPVRNDGRKEHPDLVPYDDLPEAEKEIDRKAALATVRAILALGYEIVRR